MYECVHWWVSGWMDGWMDGWRMEDGLRSFSQVPSAPEVILKNMENCTNATLRHVNGGLGIKKGKKST
ncbi:unnamed protein product [Thelazia callipaeda]|uniref:Ovule protein n=1 Tax=Thelazia callipaeda TaxID=103827 RepID=A0A0N5D6N0_THECL|nr:unnamed protein product [Thelazia callipaeda]